MQSTDRQTSSDLSGKAGNGVPLFFIDAYDKYATSFGFFIGCIMIAYHTVIGLQWVPLFIKVKLLNFDPFGRRGIKKSEKDDCRRGPQPTLDAVMRARNRRWNWRCHILRQNQNAFYGKYS